MAHLLELSVWHNGDSWYANNTDAIGTLAAKWWAPARALGMKLDEYIVMLYTDFQARNLVYNEHTDCLVFSFDSEAKAKKFASYVNSAAKARGFVV